MPVNKSNQQSGDSSGNGEKNKGSGAFNQGSQQDPGHGEQHQQSSGSKKGAKQVNQQKQGIDPGKLGSNIDGKDGSRTKNPG
jgi:hypothetical protein